MNTSPVLFGKARMLIVKNEFDTTLNELPKVMEEVLSDTLLPSHEAADSLVFKINDPVLTDRVRRIVVDGEEATYLGQAESVAKVSTPAFGKKILDFVKHGLFYAAKTNMMEKGHYIDAVVFTNGTEHVDLRHGMAITSRDENGTREYSWN